MGHDTCRLYVSPPCHHLIAADALVRISLFTVSVGALHTAPTYRRLGLGSIVVGQLANIVRTQLAANPLTSQLLRNSGGDGPKFRMHAECQAFNSVAMDWFCGLGYEKVVDNTWVMIEF